ncbi:T9SS type A sorting domain-containing protein [Lewinella sp. 4G2]|uniref:T9SS type A sorting domain-containing protein n=1 Tax=Lewinella sp. 4G2 TaxID=1803372 RepID=UPI0007B4AB36|nr:T9SS type A sorting domain-containing protein [Lewinella sp. 4G2]OAV42918.1 hypothetical protein A3850_016980 [Lewinella sp. 4G2]
MQLDFTYFRKGLTLLALLLSVGALQAQCASTLANNADFEGGLDGGTGLPNSYYLFSGAAFTGLSSNTGDGSANSAEINSTGFGAIAQTVGGIAENTEYTFAVDILRLPTEADYVGIAIYYRDMNGADIGAADFTVFADENMDWQTISRTLVSPAGTAQVQLAVQGDGVFRTDNWCFDLTTAPVTPVCENNLFTNPLLDDGDLSAYGSFANAGGSPVGTASATGGVGGSGAVQVGPLPDTYFEFYQAKPASNGEVFYGQVDAKRLATAGYAQVRFAFVDNTTFTRYGEQSMDLTSADFETFNFSGICPPEANEVRVTIVGGESASSIADNWCLSMTDPQPPVDFCPDGLVSNQTFDANISNYSTAFGDDMDITWSADQGTLNSGALRVACAANGCGTATYGDIGPGGAYELNFVAKTLVDGGFPNAEIKFFNDDYSSTLSMVSIKIEGNELIGYRLIAEATDPDIAHFAVQFNGNPGVDYVVDDVCFLPYTVEAPMTPEGELVVNGDFEAGSALTEATFRNELVQDPATGVMALTFNDPSGEYATASTPEYAVSEGAEIMTSFDSKYAGSLDFAKVNYTFRDAAGAILDVDGDDGGRVDNNIPQGEDYVRSEYTYIAPPGSATLQLQVERGSGEGYITVDNISIVNVTALPVTLSDFRGVAMNKANKITWSTSSEENTEMFYLERSRNGVDAWTEIATVNAAGNSDREVAYEAMDEQPLGASYYRLRSVDFDGATQLSDVIRIERASGVTLSAYPNPIGNAFTVETEFAETTNYSLYDALGRELRSGRLAAGFQRTEIATADLPAGRYLLRVNGESLLLVK